MNNPTPIPGSVNEKGMFTAKNPYLSHGESYDIFNKKHPQLLTYTPSNVLVTDEEHVEVVGPVWQIQHTKGLSTIKGKEIGMYTNTNSVTRQVYITIPPTEKTSLQAKQPWQDIVNELSNAPIPEAQPLEGVKTVDIEQAAELFSTNGLHEFLSPAYQGFIAGANWMKGHAQFSTDAGSSKENPYTNIPCHKCNQNSDSMQSCTCTKFEEFEQIKKNNAPAKTSLQVLSEYSWDIRDEVLQAMQAYADQFKAPSTHSSSEMVGKDAVILTIANWYHKISGSMSSSDAQDLINQIRNI